MRRLPRSLNNWSQCTGPAQQRVKHSKTRAVEAALRAETMYHWLNLSSRFHVWATFPIQNFNWRSQLSSYRPGAQPFVTRQACGSNSELCDKVYSWITNERCIIDIIYTRISRLLDDNICLDWLGYKINLNFEGIDKLVIDAQVGPKLLEFVRGGVEYARADWSIVVGVSIQCQEVEWTYYQWCAPHWCRAWWRSDQTTWASWEYEIPWRVA